MWSMSEKHETHCGHCVSNLNRNATRLELLETAETQSAIKAQTAADDWERAGTKIESVGSRGHELRGY